MSKPKIMMTRGVLIYSFFLFTFILCFSQEYEKNIELSFDQKIDSIMKQGTVVVVRIAARKLLYFVAGLHRSSNPRHLKCNRSTDSLGL